MNEKITFQTILENTVVSTGISPGEKEKIVQNLYNYVQGIMPESLYRYRRCNERSFDAFNRDCVWVSRADCMNDGFDSRLYFDRNEIITWRNQILSDEYVTEMRSFFLSEQSIPDFSANYPGLQDLLSAVRNTTEEEYQQIVGYFRDFISSDVDKLIKIVSVAMQQSNKFCCMSEDVTSSAMWGHYSENETGFALAYDFRNLNLLDQNRLCSCLPVIYGDMRYQVSIDFVKFMIQYSLLHKAMIVTGYSAIHPQAAQTILSTLPCPDIFVYTKVALHKSNEWAYEKEWRLFCNAPEDKEFSAAAHGYFIMRPKALYLGCRISSINEKILMSIAKEKNLPVYKMTLDDESLSYSLIPKRVLQIGVN